jgi:hypothetical protein
VSPSTTLVIVRATMTVVVVADTLVVVGGSVVVVGGSVVVVAARTVLVGVFAAPAVVGVVAAGTESQPATAMQSAPRITAARMVRDRQDTQSLSTVRNSF